MRLVYAFDEQAPGGRDLLGGKGVGLAEMTALGIPVPAGFTVTTEACRETMRIGRAARRRSGAEIDEHVARLQERAGKRFGDPGDPLLVSVPLGRGDLDAGDDGHDPQPRPERRRGGRPRRRHRKPALRVRLLSAADPDVRRGRATGSTGTSSRMSSRA